MTVTSDSRRRRITPKSRSTSRSDSAAVGSSMMMTLAPDDAARAISTICFCATLRVETLAEGSMEGSMAASVWTTRSSRSDRTRNPKRVRSMPSVRFS